MGVACFQPFPDTDAWVDAVKRLGMPENDRSDPGLRKSITEHGYEIKREMAKLMDTYLKLAENGGR